MQLPQSEKSVRRISRVLRAVAVLPLLAAMVVILVVALPFIAVLGLRARLSLRRFRRREAGTFYLVCTPRRGWRDFLVNNVIPVLPDDTRVVWRRRGRNAWRNPFFRHLARSGILGVPKPYLVAVEKRALAHKSLNRVLQDLKAQPKLSEGTRRACAGIVAEARNELRGTPSAAAT